MCSFNSDDISSLIVFHQPFMKLRRKGVGNLLSLGVEPRLIQVEIMPVSKREGQREREREVK